MATRSHIGIELKNGSVLPVYHHWDGYPEWLGRILRTHYNTREKVAELIDGGDMSSCWTESRIRHRAAEVPADAMPSDLQSFISNLPQ